MTARLQPHPVLSPDEMRAAESAYFAAGADSFALMTRAAAAVAQAAAVRLAPASRVLVLAGPGNNGGDGHVVARLLAEAGHHVHVQRLGLPPANGDAARAAGEWTGPVGTADPLGFDLVVDALFGIGLRRALDGEAASLVQHVNESGVPVLAVDMPSGADAASGAVPGPAIRAVETVSFHTAKPGQLLLPGRLSCGRLTVADIGLAAPKDANLFVNAPGLWALPVPAPDAHKYARGGAVVWSGPALATGASRLAAQAALRVGAGAVTLAGTADALQVQAAHVTAVMLAQADAAGLGDLLQGEKVKSVCVGPGAGPSAREAAAMALGSGKALVLDADALTAFAPDPAHLARLVRRMTRPVVLTPHDGEFGRLFPGISGSRLDRARAAAKASGAVVILKGGDSVVAAPDGRAAITVNAPAWLATAGSGDVLAGLVTGLLAQGMAGFEAAAAASYLHADMGQRLGAGLIAEDLVGPVLRDTLADLI